MLQDALVAELGLIPAAVLCVALRFCKLSDGVCRASVRTMGERLQLCSGTVHKVLKRLAAEGYLVDLTPGLRNAPHQYRDTGKASVHEVKATVHDVKATVHEVNASVHEVKATVHDVQKKRLLIDKKESLEETRARRRMPELEVFRQAAGIRPRQQVCEDVIEAVRAVSRRLGREARAEDLRPFVKAWVGRGWNPYNLNWLYEWAVSGEMAPPNRSGPASLRGACGIFDGASGASRRPGPSSATTGALGAGAASGINIGGHDRARDEVSGAERERLIRFYNGLREG